MTSAKSEILELVKVLQVSIKEQRDSSTCTDEKTTIDAKKKATKQALYALLESISSAPKDELTVERREYLDENVFLTHITTLKWPLLRSLEHTHHYRAFLGLPLTMEETRRFLTTISAVKLREILGTNLTASIVSTEKLDDLQWVEHVLHYMTGDGRRKKDLGGFVLQDKGVVRGAINKARSRRLELEQKPKSSDIATKASMGVNYEMMERDVRLVDQERQQARVNDFGTLVDEALQKKKG